jgi:hypothetical protein
MAGSCQLSGKCLADGVALADAAAVAAAAAGVIGGPVALGCGGEGREDGNCCFN